MGIIIMETYKILQTGNFYFPMKDFNKEFEIVNTMDLTFSDKEDIEFYENLIRTRSIKGLECSQVTSLSRFIWAKINKNEYLKSLKGKNYWIIPLDLHYYKSKSLKEIVVTIDVLKRVTWYEKLIAKLKRR